MVNQNNSYQPTFDHHSYFLPPINTSSLAPTTTPSSLTFTSIIQHQKILDPKQWDTNDVSQVMGYTYKINRMDTNLFLVCYPH